MKRCQRDAEIDIIRIFSQRLFKHCLRKGEFSDVTRSYAGKGVVRYAW